MPYGVKKNDFLSADVGGYSLLDFCLCTMEFDRMLNWSKGYGQEKLPLPGLLKTYLFENFRVRAFLGFEEFKGLQDTYGFLLILLSLMN